MNLDTSLKHYVQRNNFTPICEGSYTDNQRYPVVIGADKNGVERFKQGVIDAVFVMPLVLWDDEFTAYHIEGTIDDSVYFTRGRIIDDLAHPNRPSKFDPSPFGKMNQVAFDTVRTENGLEYKPDRDSYNFKKEIFKGDARNGIIRGECIDWFYNKPEPYNIVQKGTLELRIHM